MISLYRQGSSLLHKAPVGLKLLVLTMAIAAVSIFGKTLIGIFMSITFTGALFLLAGIGFLEISKFVWKLKFFLVLVLVPQVFFAGLEQGLYNSLAVLVALLLATLVSLTTKTSNVVEFIEQITKSKSFALLIALSLNSVAIVTGLAKNIVEAGKARGIRPNSVRQIINLFVISLRYADEYAEALAARGVRV